VFGVLAFLAFIPSSSTAGLQRAQKRRIAHLQLENTGVDSKDGGEAHPSSKRRTEARELAHRDGLTKLYNSDFSICSRARMEALKER
jgi:regulator of replication initiation timing